MDENHMPFVGSKSDINAKQYIPHKFEQQKVEIEAWNNTKDLPPNAVTY